MRCDLRLQGLDLGHQLGAARLVAAIRQFRLEGRQHLRPRPPQRDAPRQGAAYRSAHRNIGGRAGCRVTRPANALAFDLGQLSLGEIGQFQIVQEQVDELVAAENEAERIFAVALARAPALAAARVRPRQHVAFDELLVSGQHHVARAALAAKARLVHAIDRDADLAAFQDILDVPVLRRFLHRPLNQRLGPTQKALAILQTLATRIQAPVDDVNGHVFIRLSQPVLRACTTRPAGGPAARCSRARPCARQTRHASFRSRRPSSNRRK